MQLVFLLIKKAATGDKRFWKVFSREVEIRSSLIERQVEIYDLFPIWLLDVDLRILSSDEKVSETRWNLSQDVKLLN